MVSLWNAKKFTMKRLIVLLLIFAGQAMAQAKGQVMPGAEGATAPETLRPKDRTVGDALESSRVQNRLTDGVAGGLPARKSLRSPDRGGAGTEFSGNPRRNKPAGKTQGRPHGRRY